MGLYDYIPEHIRNILFDKVVDGAANAMGNINPRLGGKIRELRTDGSDLRDFNDAVGRAIERFAEEVSSREGPCLRQPSGDEWLSEPAASALVNVVSNPLNYRLADRDAICEVISTWFNVDLLDSEKARYANRFIVCLQEEVSRLEKFAPIYNRVLQEEQIRQTARLTQTIEELTAVTAGRVTGPLEARASQQLGITAGPATLSEPQECVAQVAPDSAEVEISLLRAIAALEDDIPEWFPVGQDSVRLRQQVTIISVPGVSSSVINEQEHLAGTSQVAVGKRFATDIILERGGSVFLLGQPGAGKSWLLRSFASRVAKDYLSSPRRDGFPPIIVSAARIEGNLANVELGLDGLAEAISKSTIDELSYLIDINVRAGLKRAVLTGRNTILLIDGYDEIKQSEPRLGELLNHLGHALSLRGGCVVLTSRPTSTPSEKQIRTFIVGRLEPFGQADQEEFVQEWFKNDQAYAGKVVSWITQRSLEALKLPLMLALFCTAISDRPADLPTSESSLWEAALQRFLSDQDRSQPLSVTSARYLTRLNILVHLANCMVRPEGIETRISAQVWLDRANDELDVGLSQEQLLAELRAVGIVQFSTMGAMPYLEFIHANFRDHLIARRLTDESGWSPYIDRFWSQPEWEQVLAYTAALSTDNAVELIGAFVDRFYYDPLNAARLCAGRAISSVGIGTAIKEIPDAVGRTIDELIIVMCSPNAWDRSSAGTVLASLGSPLLVERLAPLIHASSPTRVINSAIRVLGACGELSGINHVVKVATSEVYVPDEQVAAVEAFAASRSELAKPRLSAIVLDRSSVSQVRVAAALQAVTSFRDPSLARLLLQTSDEEDRHSRRLLVEELASNVSLLDRLNLDADPLEIKDDYCAAILQIATADDARSSSDFLRAATEVLLSEAPMGMVLGALARCEAVADVQLLAVPLAKFIVEGDYLPARWRVAEKLNEGGHDLLTTVNELFRTLPDLDAHSLSRFLAHQAMTEENWSIRHYIRGLIEGQLLDGSVGSTLHRLDRAKVAEISRLTSAPREPNAESEVGTSRLDLNEIVSGDFPPGPAYRLLIASRRVLPMRQHATFRQAAELTAAATCGQASGWIDSAPDFAIGVERRLMLGSRYQAARQELTELLSRWPRRQLEVHSDWLEGGPSDDLSIRADAALLDGRPKDALTFAYAALGSAFMTGRHASGRTLRVLLGASEAAHNSGSLWEYVRRLLMSEVDLFDALLQFWVDAPHTLRSPEVRVPRVSEFMRRTHPEVSAARLLAGETLSDVELSEVRSWSGCRRAANLARVCGLWFDSDSERRALANAVSERLNARADELARNWPKVSQLTNLSDRPFWYSHQAGVAARLLHEGEFKAAQALLRETRAREPLVASLQNDYGFSLMPTDPVEALRQLEEAGDPYGSFEPVNVANRMLLHYRAGDYPRAFSLAERWWQLCDHRQTPSCWLWNMDDICRLEADVDPGVYILILAERCADQGGDPQAASRWRRRRRRSVGSDG